ncbi:Zn-dependent hydrolase [Paenibacillus humicola]|uniref:Zn-dependent hydrolase n=1 Tax=Paenibacillus humicola TaxID=3110540 RepID=UPI00237A8F52|nr:Zn-dependent hydrolase [Paenibacillus humicola]
MINRGRLEERIERLGRIGRTPEGGVTRLALSDEDRQAQALAAEWMEQAGMSVYRDPAGNLIGRIEGMDREAPPVVIGSHIDTVQNGGKYDGAIGVLGGIEVVQHFREEGLCTFRPIEVIAFCEEEGSRFQSGMFGSRALAGMTGEADLELTDGRGITRREALAGFGLEPGRIGVQAVRRPGEVRAYLEMHIEQGPVLERAGAPVGIVGGIAGPAWMEVSVEGKAGHAGTLPMTMRRDALLGAGEIALLVEHICRSYPGTPVAGTVGRLAVLPGGTNIVPGRALFSVDIRDIDAIRREEIIERVRSGALEIGDRRGLAVRFDERMKIDPVRCSPAIVSLMKEKSLGMKLECLELVSGAGHDAQIMASITDVGMIFVRCKDGVSHHPAEFAEPADIALGTELLARVALELAAR